MSDNNKFKVIGEISKKNPHIPLKMNENHNLDQSWEIADMYMRLKDWSKEQAVFLLDRCDVCDLFDFVFREDHR